MPLPPINTLQLLLGMGVSFLASTADWLQPHLLSTLELAFEHNGFSFVHVAQRCPHYFDEGWDYKSNGWFTMLVHDNGIPVDERMMTRVRTRVHDPGNIEEAFKLAFDPNKYFGLFYRNENLPRYDVFKQELIKTIPQKPRSGILDAYLI